MTEEEIRNNERLIILDSMGGDSYARETITRVELLQDLISLSNLERLAGMYKIINHIYQNKDLQTLLSNTKNENEFINILNSFIAGLKHDKNN